MVQLSTPYYSYDMKLLGETLSSINECVEGMPYRVHYAVKANCNPVLLKAIAARGLGADVVSGGEVKLALECGFPAESIVFSGVGKSDDEIRLALTAGIGCINVESEAELDIISEIAAELGVKARIALRINPDIEAHTHKYITTGLEENKFGISLSNMDLAVATAVANPNVILQGLHFHIGSQITINEPFALLCEKVKKIIDDFSKKGIEFSYIDVGGGLGIDYEHPTENPIPDFKSYFDTFKANLPVKPGQTVHFELGRAIVAQCGTLVTKVIYIKESDTKKFVVLDAGMNALIRPALYQAYHKIENVTSKAEETAVYDVVGPICESADVFGENVTLPITRRGDIVVIRSVGAYGESMASTYNSRPIPASAYVG